MIFIIKKLILILYAATYKVVRLIPCLTALQIQFVLVVHRVRATMNSVTTWGGG